jgi:hypothetical protein
MRNFSSISRARLEDRFFVACAPTFAHWPSFQGYATVIIARAQKGDKEWTFAAADDGAGLTPSIKNKSSKFLEVTGLRRIRGIGL